jgi:hypothetical protein
MRIGGYFAPLLMNIEWSGYGNHHYISKITTPFQSSFDTFLTLSLFEHFYDNL